MKSERRFVYITLRMQKQPEPPLSHIAQSVVSDDDRARPCWLIWREATSCRKSYICTSQYVSPPPPPPPSFSLFLSRGRRYTSIVKRGLEKLLSLGIFVFLASSSCHVALARKSSPRSTGRRAPTGGVPVILSTRCDVTKGSFSFYLTSSYFIPASYTTILQPSWLVAHHPKSSWQIVE